MDFSGASIGGSPIFNNVEGDQHNRYFNGKVIYVREEKRRTKYDEFRYIISGDIYGLEEIATRDIRDLWHFPNGPTSPLQVKAQRTIYSAKLQSFDNTSFTVVSYSGPDAHVAWEKDFLDSVTHLILVD
ncbi:hypothetical protein VNI00_003676 [Paramarasmius palmivorus]|uniref:Uncharacterized protein n=1 Tax=Paramarasmius palmivorus TaxID=297713 RepID=A0AAW0DSA8_9AGAR